MDRVTPGPRLLTAIVLMAGPAHARQDHTAAPAESAAVARAAWARAVEASRARDFQTALKEVERAAAAWPTQPAYQWGRARLAAQTGDTAAMMAALRHYAKLGLGRDLLGDSVIGRYREAAGFDAIRAAHDAHRSPLVNGSVLVTAPDSTFWPEGLDHDPRTGNFYLTSVRHRTVAELSPTGRVRELLSRHQPGMGSILGVRVDTARQALWITTSGLPQMEGYTPGDSAIAAVVLLRISDGAVERRWDLAPSSRGHVLGDLAIGPAGEVYVTDSSDPVLYVLPPGVDSLRPLRHPLFRSLQGVAPAPGGEALYLADYSHGLLRVDLATGGVVRLDDAPHSTSLGCDGLAWDRGALICVQNGVAPPRIMRFVLDETGGRIVRAEVLDRNLPIADEPTIGTMVGSSFVYVANSQWEKYSNDGQRIGSAPLVPPVLVRVPVLARSR